MAEGGFSALLRTLRQSTNWSPLHPGAAHRSSFGHSLIGCRHSSPYEKLAVSWGYHNSITMRFVFNHSFPTDFLRWYLATGALWKSVIFQEWIRSKQTLLWCDVARPEGAIRS